MADLLEQGQAHFGALSRQLGEVLDNLGNLGSSLASELRGQLPARQRGGPAAPKRRADPQGGSSSGRSSDAKKLKRQHATMAAAKNPDDEDEDDQGDEEDGDEEEVGEEEVGVPRRRASSEEDGEEECEEEEEGEEEEDDGFPDPEEEGGGEEEEAKREEAKREEEEGGEEEGEEEVTVRPGSGHPQHVLAYQDAACFMPLRRGAELQAGWGLAAWLSNAPGRAEQSLFSVAAMAGVEEERTWLRSSMCVRSLGCAGTLGALLPGAAWPAAASEVSVLRIFIADRESALAVKSNSKVGRLIPYGTPAVHRDGGLDDYDWRYQGDPEWQPPPAASAAQHVARLREVEQDPLLLLWLEFHTPKRAPAHLFRATVCRCCHTAPARLLCLHCAPPLSFVQLVPLPPSDWDTCPAYSTRRGSSALETMQSQINLPLLRAVEFRSPAGVIHVVADVDVADVLPLVELVVQEYRCARWPADPSSRAHDPTPRASRSSLHTCISTHEPSPLPVRQLPRQLPPARHVAQGDETTQGARGGFVQVGGCRGVS